MPAERYRAPLAPGKGGAFAFMFRQAEQTEAGSGPLRQARRPQREGKGQRNRRRHLRLIPLRGGIHCQQPVLGVSARRRRTIKAIIKTVCCRSAIACWALCAVDYSFSLSRLGGQAACTKVAGVLLARCQPYKGVRNVNSPAVRAVTAGKFYSLTSGQSAVKMKRPSWNVKGDSALYFLYTMPPPAEGQQPLFLMYAALAGCTQRYATSKEDKAANALEKNVERYFPPMRLPP